MYHEVHFPKASANTEIVFGAVLNRVEDESVIAKEYTAILTEYIDLSVKKHLGITITEYIDLDYSVRESYIKLLVDIAKQEEEAMNNIKNYSDDLEGALDV